MKKRMTLILVLGVVIGPSTLLFAGDAPVQLGEMNNPTHMVAAQCDRAKEQNAVNFSSTQTADPSEGLSARSAQ